ncbi:hypothetical protein NUITMVRA1_13320 [Aerococcus viridans]|uniref:hypothetical protein n=1 Tax=Aerococcus viridans TaxID=1377 RepID=UPI0028FD4354|nr:hypothetical protein NUITMVRA1_13320 [Aerococcus viridans]
MANFSGFTFDGKHSYRDMGMTIDPERNISIPNKIKYKESLPFSNKVWDFSSIYGGPTYEERTLTYKFNLMGKPIESKADMNMIKTVLLKWLLSPNEKTPLYDDHFPDFYFMAEVEGNNSFEEDWKHGFLKVTFTAQPFMIDRMPEGHDLVAFMKTRLDVRQKTNFTYKSSWSSFKQLNIGDQATYGAWATVYQTDTGTGTKINPGFHGYTYKIVDKKTVSQSRSQIAYKLDNHNEWLLEQDIVQAQTEYLDVVIVNPGISDVAPIITTNNSVTIVRDDEIYNLQPGVYETEQFVLKSGENHLKMYIPNVTLNIDFNFHKELI